MIARRQIKETRNWKMPKLSEGSVATYATPELMGFQDEQMDGEDELVPGMYRTLPLAKTAEFEEESVLFGVRFVVG